MTRRRQLAALQVDIASKMGALLKRLLAEGWQPPFHVCGVGTNGAMMGFHMVTDPDAGDLRAEEAFNHSPPEGLVLPINIMVTDPRGEAARLVIARDGSSRIVN